MRPPEINKPLEGLMEILRLHIILQLLLLVKKRKEHERLSFKWLCIHVHDCIKGAYNIFSLFLNILKYVYTQKYIENLRI